MQVLFFYFVLYMLYFMSKLSFVFGRIYRVHFAIRSRNSRNVHLMPLQSIFPHNVILNSGY